MAASNHRCGLRLMATGLFKKCAFHPHICHFYMGSPRASRSFSRSMVFGNLGSNLNARIKKQSVQRWKGMLRAQCYGKSTKLQSPALPIGGVACRTRPFVHFLPKISLQVKPHRKLLGSSEAAHTRQLRLYFSGVVQRSPARSCKCSGCGNSPVRTTSV